MFIGIIRITYTEKVEGNQVTTKSREFPFIRLAMFVLLCFIYIVCVSVETIEGEKRKRKIGVGVG